MFAGLIASVPRDRYRPPDHHGGGPGRLWNRLSGVDHDGGTRRRRRDAFWDD